MQGVSFSKISAFIVLLGSVLIFESCRPEPTFNTDPNFSLEFSNDTIRFDTVFTSLGSTNLWLQVYNRSNRDVDIQRLELVRGENSPFRMNVSGHTSLVQSHVRLRAQDSLFIFVTVTIDPNDSTNPFLAQDFIRFSFNNRTQDVVLQAFGQNAHYHIPKRDTLEMFCPIANDTLRLPFSIATPSDFVNTEKPHVIFGFLLVQSGDTLVLDGGTRLHFAPNSGLIVADGGSLRINGSFENEVIFDGMRMDAAYRNITGQWNRIWLSPGSIVHNIDWAIIQNGRIGLLVDSMPNLNHPLVIRNTIINNMQTHGIFATNARILGTSLQVSNAGERLLALIGGDYTFEHCTFANYFAAPNFIRRHASILLDTTSLHPLIHANFTSSIIFGTMQDELEIRPLQTENINFSYCNIRTRINPNNRMFQNGQINTNPQFRNPSNINGDFDIAPNSPVIGAGRPGPSISRDLRDRPRPLFPNSPTIGAYEFTE